MLILLGIVIATQLVTNVVLVTYMLRLQVKDHRDFSHYLLNLFESAMGHLRTKTLDEKVAAESAKTARDVQLAYLKDTLAKQAYTESVRETPPAFLKSSDGREFSASDIEIL